MKRSVRLVPWASRRHEVIEIVEPEEQKRFISGQTVVEFLADDDHPTFSSFAVCDSNVVVGLVCYGQEPDHEPWKWWVPLIVVDGHHQRTGYGRAAMEEVISRLRKVAACRAIGLSCEPTNAVAMSLYRSLGFETGDLNSRGEVEMWLMIGDT